MMDFPNYFSGLTVIGLTAISVLMFSRCDQPMDVTSEDEVYPYLLPSELYCPQGHVAYDSVSVLKYDDGELFSVSFFSDTIRNGVEVFFHKNGELMSKKYYCMGEVIGRFQRFYDDGSLQSTGNHRGGAMDGIWKYYYPDGQLREVVNFRENQEYGPFREYYPSGNLKARGFYIEPDREQGLLTLYREDGTIKRLMDCNNGICNTIYEPSES